MATLLLFSRAGCCLCQGLEERLRALQPPPQFLVINVDDDPALQARWGLEVPVLAELDEESEGSPPHAARPLPRVPPRLEGERLRQWLERHGIHAPQDRAD
jgi:hypothetical protein